MIRLYIDVIHHDEHAPIIEVVMDVFYGKGGMDEMMADIVVSRTVGTLEKIVDFCDGMFINDELIGVKDEKAPMGVIVIIAFEEEKNMEKFVSILADVFE